MARHHFLDRIIGKILERALPPGNGTARQLQDQKLRNVPLLLLSTLSLNIKSLSTRMSVLFQLQYTVVRLVTWNRPSATLGVLVLYTAACVYPFLLLAYPMLYLLLAVMLPAYAYRHPIPRPEILPTRKRGQTLVEFLSISTDHSIAEDLIGESAFMDSTGWQERPQADLATPEDSEELSPQTTVTLEPGEDTGLAGESGLLLESKTANLARLQVELFVNLRDFQNLTTDLVRVYDAAEDFVYGLAGFKDERALTLMFLSVLMCIGAVVAFGRFIPWRLLFIVQGWAVVGACHPHLAKHIKRFHQVYIVPRNERINRAMKDMVAKSERYAVLLDEGPEVREVEVFELEQRGVTPRQWLAYCFLPTPFELSSSPRQAHRRPDGAVHLHEVLPPRGWKFDLGEDNDWRLDYNATRYVKERGMGDVRVDEQNEWVYDTVSGEYDAQWRRRRWVRNCYRFARPARRAPRHSLVGRRRE